ncbi:MAG: hypothetical protein ACSHWW_10985 [Nonlabens sp.]|uniref:hypothetical protein n=1 Tax=Nonlabens sp. TaxID=1888209 RepID=UPI003EF08FBE
MDQLFSMLRLVYDGLLITNLIFFSIALIKGKKDFKFIFLYILASILTEGCSYLVEKNYVLILGEQSNAPLFLAFVFIQFIFLSLFYRQHIVSKEFKKWFPYLLFTGLVVAAAPYVWQPSEVMKHTMWASLITIPVLLIMSVFYFLQLLNDKKGYPYINIGIFLAIGSNVIYLTSIKFQEDVDHWAGRITMIINLFTTIALHILLLYQCYKYFKSQTRPSIT